MATTPTLHNTSSTYIPQTHPRHSRGWFIPWRWQARTLRLATLALGLASLIGWFNLTQATQQTTTVIRWHQLASQLEKLRRENAQLRYQIARAGELATLRRWAAAQGFALPQQAEYIYLPGYPEGRWGRQGLEATPTPVPPQDLWDRFLTSLRLLLTGES